MAITRVVKMTFKPEEVGTFHDLFSQESTTIRSFEGCIALDVYHDSVRPEIIFTISQWEHSQFLEAYRTSDFFAQTWKKTKILFAEKAEAWTLYHGVTDVA